MARSGPRINSDIRRCLIIAVRHPTPLWVEQNLQLVASSREVDNDNRDTRVILIRVPSRCSWITRQTGSGHSGDVGSAGRVENLHLHRLAIESEGGGGSSGVDADGRVGVHAPHDGTRRVDFIL